MGRTYKLTTAGGSLTGAMDLFEFTPATGKPVEIVGIVIGQSSDVGDALSESLDLKISRGWGTSGSGGTASLVPAPCNSDDTAAGFTYERLNTTLASTGTEVVCFADVWNTQAGYQMWFPEGTQDVIRPGVICTVRPTAPADPVTVSATLFVREL